jgi:hypothetical protein
MLQGPREYPEDEDGDAINKRLDRDRRGQAVGPEAILSLGFVENGHTLPRIKGEPGSHGKSRNFDGMSRGEQLENQSHQADGDEKE